MIDRRQEAKRRKHRNFVLVSLFALSKSKVKIRNLEFSIIEMESKC